jgi:hypothetical protein
MDYSQIPGLAFWRAFSGLAVLAEGHTLTTAPENINKETSS